MTLTNVANPSKGGAAKRAITSSAEAPSLKKMRMSTRSPIRLRPRVSSAMVDNLQGSSSTTTCPTGMPPMLLSSATPIPGRLEASSTSIPNQSSNVDDDIQSSSVKPPSKMPGMALFNTTPVSNRREASTTSIRNPSFSVDHELQYSPSAKTCSKTPHVVILSSTPVRNRLEASLTSTPGHSSRLAADIAPLETPIKVINDNFSTPGSYQSSGWTCVNRPTPKVQLEASMYFTPDPIAINPRKQLTTKYVEQQAGSDDNILYPESGFTDNELQDIAGGGTFTFKKYQTREIILWMVRNNARSVILHAEAFKELLDTLGFANAVFSDALKKQLRLKTCQKISRTGTLMRKANVITVADDNLPTETSTFAPWTEAWLDPAFDGPMEMPSHWKASAEKNEAAAAVEAQQSFRFDIPDSMNNFEVEKPQVPSFIGTADTPAWMNEERFEVEELQVPSFTGTADTSEARGGVHGGQDHDGGYETTGTEEGMWSESDGEDDEIDDEDTLLRRALYRQTVRELLRAFPL